MNVAPIIVFVGVLVFLAHLFAGIFSRTKIPDVLFLILIGLCVGPLLGIVAPRNFGAVGPVFTTITLVIILFESGIGLRLHSLQKALKGTLTVTILNFVVSMAAVGLITSVLTDLEIAKGLMLGAILGGTASAVVIPLIGQLKMQSESRTILFLESALTDVLCIVVAIAFIEALKLGQFRLGVMMGHILSSFLLAGLFGITGACAWSILLNKMRTFQNSIFTTPAFVFVIFGMVEMLGYSGAIASLAFGITLGNLELFDLPFLKRYIPHEPIALTETEKIFFSEVVFLLKTFFFVYLGLSIQLTDFWSVYLGLIITVTIFILRVPTVRISIHKSTPVQDACLMAVMAPRGLAAAVLASIPLQQGIAGGELIQGITYAVVLFSIVLTSLLIILLDKTALSKVFGWIFSGFVQPLPDGLESIENRTLVDEASDKVNV